MIHAIVNQGNEMDRYLPAFYKWNKQYWDSLFVYDDCSTDWSFDFAYDHADVIIQRNPADPGFKEHEGEFRQQSWDLFQSHIGPKDGDWILAIDTDEFLVMDDPDMLRQNIDNAELCGKMSVQIGIPEVWIANADLYVRQDGFWPDQKSGRLFRYLPGGMFRLNRPMGCGSMPTYAEKSVHIQDDLHLLHFGYALEKDRQSKYNRYSMLGGHNKKHIESIVTEPELKKWEGQVPAWQV